jgi:hypothetical protein
MKLRVDISHLQGMYFRGETARGVCLHTGRSFVSYRSCEAFVCFSFVLFAFFVRLRLVRIVNLYDPGSVLLIVLRDYIYD